MTSNPEHHIPRDNEPATEERDREPRRTGGDLPEPDTIGKPHGGAADEQRVDEQRTDDRRDADPFEGEPDPARLLDPIRRRAP